MKRFAAGLIIVFICFFISENFAQIDKGYVRLKIQNARKPLCKIDDSLAIRVNDTTLTLTPGSHRIKIWIPTTSLIDTSVFVKTNDTSKYIFKVNYTREYTKYLNDYSKYRQIRKQRWFISPFFIIGSVGGALMANTKANNYVYKALRNKEEYSSAGSQSLMDASESSFLENKKKFRRYEAIEIGLYSVAGILTANYIRLLVKQHHTLPPNYKEEKLLSRIKLNTYPDFATRKLFLGLSINF